MVGERGHQIGHAVHRLPPVRRCVRGGALAALLEPEQGVLSRRALPTQAIGRPSLLWPQCGSSIEVSWP
ncbi:MULTISPECIES: hypothetical protein [Streptomyces]|uniref:hypothetical protein n=1 Tax=Streptomyces TaxID=1883 RepID=UPI002556182B|nr:hypothetical protein [Streptomyces sp. NBRC 13847]